MAKRRLKPEDQATLSALRERLLLTLAFFENAQEFPSGRRFRDLVESAAAAES
jgi:hypothetical protein